MSRRTVLNRRKLKQATSKGRDKAESIAILSLSNGGKPRRKPFNVASGHGTGVGAGKA